MIGPARALATVPVRAATARADRAAGPYRRLTPATYLMEQPSLDDGVRLLAGKHLSHAASPTGQSRPEELP